MLKHFSERGGDADKSREVTYEEARARRSSKVTILVIIQFNDPLHKQFD